METMITPPALAMPLIVMLTVPALERNQSTPKMATVTAMPPTSRVTPFFRSAGVPR